MKILKYFKFNVYYLWIDAKTDIKKNEIATKLKKNNIFPLPIELENKILSNAGFAIYFQDPDEFGILLFSDRHIFLKFPFRSLSSIKIVKFFVLSLKCFDLIRDGK